MTPNLVSDVVRRMALAAMSAAAIVHSSACASAPPAAPRPGTAILWGHARLVPRPGVEPDRGGDGHYADPRYSHAELVEYARVDFAVVYVEGPAPARGHSAAIVLEESRFGSRFTPEIAAVARGGAVVVRNATREAHALSCPGAGLLRTLAPGEEITIDVPAAGEITLHVLDDRNAAATVFVAPGPFVVTTGNGRFEFRDIPPGRYRLGSWHPRFPGETIGLDLRAGEVKRSDVEIGVGQIENEKGTNR